MSARSQTQPEEIDRTTWNDAIAKILCKNSETQNQRGFHRLKKKKRISNRIYFYSFLSNISSCSSLPLCCWLQLRMGEWNFSMVIHSAYYNNKRGDATRQFIQLLSVNRFSKIVVAIGIRTILLISFAQNSLLQRFRSKYFSPLFFLSSLLVPFISSQFFFTLIRFHLHFNANFLAIFHTNSYIYGMSTGFLLVTQTIFAFAVILLPNRYSVRISQNLISWISEQILEYRNEKIQL